MRVRAARLITPGNFEDDLRLVADCDWIVEAVAENLAIKRALLARVEQHRRPGTIVTTNTSGLPVASIVEGMAEELRRHWFGTHFFNPPRYMRLLEVIATPETDAADVAAIAQLLRPAAGQGGGAGARYAELYREPHWHVFDAECDSADDGAGADDRRGRYADRGGAGLAEDGDVPAGRHGGRGCAGACGGELCGAGGADRR